MCSSWCFCLPSVTCCLPSLQHLVNLFARLSNDNIGYVDWDPYIPKVCFFFFRSPSPATCFSTCLFWDLGHTLSCVAWWPFMLLPHGVYFMATAVPQRNALSSFLVDLAVGHWREVTCIMTVLIHVFLTSPSCDTDKQTHSPDLFGPISWAFDQCNHKLVYIKMIIRHEPFNSYYFVSHISDFHKNIEELESPCGHQSDDGTTLHHQCLRYQSCGALGVVPPG